MWASLDSSRISRACARTSVPSGLAACRAALVVVALPAEATKGDGCVTRRYTRVMQQRSLARSHERNGSSDDILRHSWHFFFFLPPPPRNSFLYSCRLFEELVSVLRNIYSAIHDQ